MPRGLRRWCKSLGSCLAHLTNEAGDALVQVSPVLRCPWIAPISPQPRDRDTRQERRFALSMDRVPSWLRPAYTSPRHPDVTPVRRLGTGPDLGLVPERELTDRVLGHMPFFEKSPRYLQPD
jgi:hypothetical protein